MKFDDFFEIMKQGVVAIFVLGLFAYSLLVAAYAVGHGPAFMDGTAKAYMFGLPICGIASFAIVSVLERLGRSSESGDGKLEFKAFGLAFTGPAGPVTLWIVCYLTLVVSMKIVKA